MSVLKKLVKSEAGGGIVLILAAALAIILANSGFSRDAYQQFLQWQCGGTQAHPLNTVFWINDVLMVFFFLLVGLEVKREMVSGALASRQQALFPLIAALGGMLAPALIFCCLMVITVRHSAAGPFLLPPILPLRWVYWRYWVAVSLSP